MAVDIPEARIQQTSRQGQGRGDDAPAAPILLEAGTAPEILVPGGAMLLSADFSRSGSSDLMIAGRDGTLVMIRDYFDGDTPADLSTGAATLPGHTVELLAGRLAPDC